MAPATTAAQKKWKPSGLANSGRVTPWSPFSPPVTSVQWNAISKKSCVKAKVRSEK